MKLVRVHKTSRAIACQWLSRKEASADMLPGTNVSRCDQILAASWRVKQLLVFKRSTRSQGGMHNWGEGACRSITCHSALNIPAKKLHASSVAAIHLITAPATPCLHLLVPTCDLRRMITLIIRQGHALKRGRGACL